MKVSFSDDYSFYIAEQSCSDLTNWGWQFASDKTTGAIVRFVRGSKAKTIQSLFDEFAASLQFPYYFGGNWNAFADCITDLDWLEGKMLVLIILDADQVLIDEPSKELETLMGILQNAREDRNISRQSLDLSEQYDLPFYTLLQCSNETKGALLSRLEKTNTSFDYIEL